jgi:hypothetical protein
MVRRMRRDGSPLLRVNGVLRSSQRKLRQIVHLGDAPSWSRPLSSFAVERFLHSFRRPPSSRILGARGLASLKPLRPYAFQIALALYWPILLYADTQIQTLTQQYALGLLTFAFLFVATRFSPPTERRQVWLMVAIATCVELFLSLVWGLYQYRWGNVPLFVPPGHGLLYLFALRAARTPLMLDRGRTVKHLALACATLWAVGGLTVAPLFLGSVDIFGALFLPVFVVLMRRPRALVYAACFFIAVELELVGTGFGNWAWATSAPVINLPAGNPPSVIAGGYCVLDAVVSKAASFVSAGSLLPRWLSRLSLGWLKE